jgi:hypothetical protein
MKQFISAGSWGALLAAVVCPFDLRDGAAVVERPAAGVVTGVVVVEGEPPAPQSWKLDDAMRQATGEQTYADETWLVGPGRGLANCLVTLRAKDPAKRPETKPQPGVVLEKVGVRFVPRVLVVTPGTEVTLRNPGSPCRGFMVQGQFHSVSYMIPEGKEQRVTFTRRDVCTVTCGARPYMTGFVHVVDTPLFAVTGADGRFRISGVPPGEYAVTVRHEAAGRLSREAGPNEVTVAAGGEHALRFQARVPGGR